MALQIHKNHRPGVVVRNHSLGEQMPSYVKRSLWTALVLVILLVAAGVLYTWYMGKQPRNLTQNVSSPPQAPTIAKPTIDPNTPVGVSVQSITSPLAPGSNAGITIRTKPEATCSISVKYNEVASTDSGLKPKKADEFGVNSWTWTVEATAPVGKWPVEVSCERDKKVGVVKTTLELKAPGLAD